MNLPPGITITAVTEELRKVAAKAVMEVIGEILIRISSNESGRIMETVVQLLPDDAFNTLATLVIGHESDEIARNLIFELVFRVANKLGLEFEATDPISEAASSTLVIINCENLRRKGHMEYLAPDNVFTSHPKHPGYNKLTDSGKQILYKEILDTQPKPKFLM
jgi:hypothetical protein